MTGMADVSRGEGIEGIIALAKDPQDFVQCLQFPGDLPSPGRFLSTLSRSKVFEKSRSTLTLPESKLIRRFSDS